MEWNGKTFKRAYYLWLKSQPCVVCGHLPKDPASLNEADHVRIPTEKGGRLRTHKGRYAYAALPLCNTCHRKKHEVGEMDFYFSSGIEIEEALIFYLTSFLYEIEERGVCGILEEHFLEDECF